MSEDFMQIKTLEGELKLSHKKRDLGLTISTKELVVQKPHVNYHIRLKDIVSIVPAEGITWKPKIFVSKKSARHEVVSQGVGLKHYRIHASEAIMHNRSGIHELGLMELIMPIHPDLLEVIAQYGQLNSIT